MNKLTDALNRLRAEASGVVDVVHLCAVHGKPYIARYARNDDTGFFSYVTSIRPPAPNSNQLPGPSIPAREIQLDRRSLPQTCAWCGSGARRWKTSTISEIHCGRCEFWVCTGRFTDGRFRCSDRCGNSGELSGESTPLSGVPHTGGENRGPKTEPQRQLPRLARQMIPAAPSRRLLR